MLSHQQRGWSSSRSKTLHIISRQWHTAFISTLSGETWTIYGKSYRPHPTMICVFVCVSELDVHCEYCVHTLMGILNILLSWNSIHNTDNWCCQTKNKHTRSVRLIARLNTTATMCSNVNGTTIWPPVARYRISDHPSANRKIVA